MRFNEILQDFIYLFFPNYCRGCEESLVKGERIICTRCMLDLPKSNYHLERDNPFYLKFSGRIPVKFVMTLFKFVKRGKVQHLLHALKYKNQPEIGVQLGRVYGADLIAGKYKDQFDVIVPVPLHPSKRKKRGYNQSEEFGKGLSEVLEIPCTEKFLKRIKATSTQTRKSKLSRWENVSEVFEVQQEEELKGKRVLLVDDVVTTGATLEACGQKLLKAGCGDVSIACIAATQ
ncbi:MAG TPA: phosphoribosyltransferase family protein [Chryseosolibacter sp.]